MYSNEEIILGLEVAKRLTDLVYVYNSSTVASFSYTYDAVGNGLSMTDTAGTHNYTYDNRYQLTQATHPALSTEDYSYDQVGNRNSGTYNTANQLTENDSYIYSYDNNGNTTEKVSKATGEVMRFTWNAENQLKRMEIFASAVDSVPTATARYIYDGMGRRVAKIVDAVVTKYLYDNEDILLELDGNDNVVARYTHGPGIDEPVSMERGGQTYYYVTDGLGSVVKIVDVSGIVVNSYEYDSFGNIASKTEGVANFYTYTGREYDSESGLYYYRARYYDAKIRRFLSEDSLDLDKWEPADFNKYIYVDSVGKPSSSDTNLYLYANNNSINYTDPLGLWYVDIGVSVGWWGGVTGGIMIGPEGVYPYKGGGIVSPWGGASVTWSPNDPTPGWNVGGQAGWWLGTQQGYTFGEKGGWFQEYGFVTPGFSVTGYKVSEPWKWPWKRGECEK